MATQTAKNFEGASETVSKGSTPELAYCAICVWRAVTELQAKRLHCLYEVDIRTVKDKYGAVCSHFIKGDPKYITLNEQNLMNGGDS